MADANGMADKNLSNVVEQLEQNPVNSHHQQQLRQDKNDRRHQAALNHDHTEDLTHPKTT